MQKTSSTLRALALLPRSLRLWLAYDAGFIALWSGRKLGLFSDAPVEAIGIPIFLNWIFVVMRWLRTGSPAPRRSLPN